MRNVHELDAQTPTKRQKAKAVAAFSKRPKLSAKQKTVAKMKLYGNLMADLLYLIKTSGRVPDDIRARAEHLQVKWDAVSPHSFLNPVTIIELEKALQD